MYWWDQTFYSLTLGSCCWLFPVLLYNTGNNQQSDPLVSASPVRHPSPYIILYIPQKFLWLSSFLLQIDNTTPWARARSQNLKFRGVSTEYFLKLNPGVFPSNIYHSMDYQRLICNKICPASILIQSNCAGKIAWASLYWKGTLTTGLGFPNYIHWADLHMISV